MRVSSKLPKTLGMPPRRTVSVNREVQVVEAPEIPPMQDAPLKNTRPRPLAGGVSVKEARENPGEKLQQILTQDLELLLPGVGAEDLNIMRIAQQVISQAQDAYTDLDAAVLVLNCAFKKGSLDPEKNPQPTGTWFSNKSVDTLATALLLVLTWLQRLRQRILNEGLSEKVPAKQELIRNVVEELLLGPEKISQILGKSS